MEERKRRIAIVHDWLVTYAGAERVLEQMIKCYPDADLFSLVDFLPQGQRHFIQKKTVRTSFIQKLPFAGRKYRCYLPLMPLAIEQLDLSSYDLVLSSSHAVAKGVLTGSNQLHICLCYSPMRYAWDLQKQYLTEAGLDHGIKGWVAKFILHYMRLWDARTSFGVDHFIAISKHIERRINRIYKRNAEVIYPPVDLDQFSVNAQKETFYVTVSRMVPYKKMDMIVSAFSAMPDKKLVVIGDGPDFKKVKAKAGNNIILLGFADASTLRDYLQRAKAFVFAAEEDFGIAPIEAQACGTPVIAFAKGGILETIVPLQNHEQLPIDIDILPPTGLFFYEQSVAAIVNAIIRFEAEGDAITPSACRANAERFSAERFCEEFSQFVEEKWRTFEIVNKDEL